MTVSTQSKEVILCKRGFTRRFPNVVAIPDEIWAATKQTIYMSFWTALVAGILGFS